MQNIKKISRMVSVDMGCLIGQGSTGDVYRGVRIQPHSHPVAVKMIPLNKIDNEVVSYLLQCEVEALKMTSSNPNDSIVKMEDIIVFENNCCIVMELLEGGSLRELIKSNKTLGQSRAIELLRKILLGCLTMTNNGIVHRDLKSDNIILSNAPEGTLNPKIIDFGYCQVDHIQNKPKMMYNVGSPRYMSPEAYLHNHYSQKSDIWSVGVIFYEMLTGTNFDKGRNISDTFKLIKNRGIPIPSSLSPHSKKLLQAMLMYDPRKRANCQTLLELLSISTTQSMIQSSRPSIFDSSQTASYSLTPHRYLLSPAKFKQKHESMPASAMFQNIPFFVNRSNNPKHSLLSNNLNQLHYNSFQAVDRMLRNQQVMHQSVPPFVFQSYKTPISYSIIPDRLSHESTSSPKHSFETILRNSHQIRNNFKICNPPQINSTHQITERADDSESNPLLQLNLSSIQTAKREPVPRVLYQAQKIHPESGIYIVITGNQQNRLRSKYAQGRRGNSPNKHAGSHDTVLTNAALNNNLTTPQDTNPNRPMTFQSPVQQMWIPSSQQLLQPQPHLRQALINRTNTRNFIKKSLNHYAIANQGRHMIYH